jgi:hypothetical protein
MSTVTAISFKPKATRKRLQKEILSDDFKKRKIFWKNIAENFPPHITIGEYRWQETPARLRSPVNRYEMPFLMTYDDTFHCNQYSLCKQRIKCTYVCIYLFTANGPKSGGRIT